MLFLLYSSIFCFLHAIDAKSLPSFITRCHKSDPNLSECIKLQVEKLRPRLLKGIPELHIPPYDPIEIPELAMEQGTASVIFNAYFKNIQVYGAHNCDINSIKLDLDNPRLDIQVHFPKMRIKTKYTIGGKVLVVPVQGSGSSDGNFTNVNSNVTIFGVYEKRNGSLYVKPTNHRVNLTIGGAYMDFDNLFNGNRELTVTINRFINENWKDIVKELNPVIADATASVVFQIVEHLFDNYSVDEVLPP